MLSIIVVYCVSLVIVDRYLVDNGDNRTLHSNKEKNEKDEHQKTKDKNERERTNVCQKTIPNNASRKKKDRKRNTKEGTYKCASFRSLYGNLFRGTDTCSRHFFHVRDLRR